MVGHSQHLALNPALPIVAVAFYSMPVDSVVSPWAGQNSVTNKQEQHAYKFCVWTFY